MTNVKSNCIKFASAGILAFSALAGFLAPVTASAALVSGVATITIDNTALIAASNLGEFVEKHWGPADNNLGIEGSTTGGTALSLTGSTAMLFPVNGNLTTTYCNSCGSYGRSLQATTMDAGDTSVGQIGLSGGWRMNNASYASVATPYDFHLVKTSGVWTIKTYDTIFTYQPFLTLTNVSESLNSNGELLLSGNLQMTGLWASLAQVSSNAVIGSFTLAPVPVPAAVWMFGGGLLGLLGVARKKAVAA